MQTMSNAEYHRHPAISKSGLDQIAKSPAHFQLYRNTPKESTTDMDIGTAFHSLLLEPEKFDSDILVCDASTRSTKIYKDLSAANPDKTIIMRDEKIMLDGMRKSFEANTTVNGLLGSSLVEKSFFWTDKETGVECRCRPDIIFNGHILIDLKSTRDARGFSRSAAEYRLHVQSAFYMTGFQAVTGVSPKEFLFITVEKSAPHGVITYRADDSFLKSGFEAMRRDLNLYAACLKTDIWPCYPESIQDLKLPVWAV